VDNLYGFDVDLGNAEPKYTLALSVSDTLELSAADPVVVPEPSPVVLTHGDISTLTLTYKQDRGYDAYRIFELKIPKFPIHYIKEGFVPVSSHPDKKDDGSNYVMKY